MSGVSITNSGGGDLDSVVCGGPALLQRPKKPGSRPGFSFISACPHRGLRRRIRIAGKAETGLAAAGSAKNRELSRRCQRPPRRADFSS
jgi:hypothetical protein